MKGLIRFTLILALAAPALAWCEEITSPIDAKYQKKNPDLYASFDQAREILNGNRYGSGSTLDDAGSLLSAVLFQDEEFAPAHREFGRLQIMRGVHRRPPASPVEMNPVEKSIKRSIEIEPDYADAYVLLGHYYTIVGRFPEAEVALARAEEIGTDSPWLELNLADLYGRQGQYEKAMALNLEIAEKGSDNRKAYGTALYRVALFYQNNGQYPEADYWHKKQLEHDPEDAWSWGNYAAFRIYYMGDYDGAITNGERALALKNYQMVKDALAMAWFCKWAAGIEEGKSAAEMQSTLDKAQSYHWDLAELAVWTLGYEATRPAGKTWNDYSIKRRQAQPGWDWQNEKTQ